MGLGSAQMGLGLYPAALQSYGKAESLAPDDVQILTNKARALSATGELTEALKCLDRALQISPDNAEAMINRGDVLTDLHRPEDAIIEYRRALTEDPENASAMCNLGNALLEAGDPVEALSACAQAITLDPGLPDALQNYGNALRDLKRFPEALEYYERARKLAPDRPDPYWNESLCRLLLGDLENGWRHYDRGWNNGQRGKRKPQFGKPTWNGTRFSGTLLAWGEQGIGDQILHCSMLDDLRQRVRRLVVAVDPRLLPLMHRSFPNIEFIALSDILRFDDFDAQLSLGDLGAFFRRSWSEFPERTAFLKADSERTRQLRSSLSAERQLVCGISWRSSNARMGKFKSAVLKDFVTVLATAGVTGVDLQYGDTSAERAALQRETGLELAHLDNIDTFNDIDGLAALISACDMVISVSNTTVHLSGALGVPTTVMLPHALGRLWYWHENKDHSPWYPSCRLLHQPANGDWASVLNVVSDTVRSAVAKR
jgi:Flp pilus assembly protein TadD